MKKSLNQQLGQNRKIFISFLMGAAISTLGWYFSDRLNIAIGAPTSINEIGRSWSEYSNRSHRCKPSDTPTESKTINGCKVLTTKQECRLKRKYISLERTRSGTHITESETPKFRSIQVAKYDIDETDEEEDLNEALSSAEEEISEYKRGKNISELSRDSKYQKLVNNQNQIKEFARKIGTKCQVTSTPKPTNTTKPTSTPKPSPSIKASATPKPSITTTTNGCIITIDGTQYEITDLRRSHSGGDIFKCGTDMSSLFWNKHNQKILNIMSKYKI